MRQPISAELRIKMDAVIHVILSKPASACDGPVKRLAADPIPPKPSPLGE